jgi:hypothetical protein
MSAYDAIDAKRYRKLVAAVLRQDVLVGDAYLTIVGEKPSVDEFDAAVDKLKEPT